MCIPAKSTYPELRTYAAAEFTETKPTMYVLNTEPTDTRNYPHFQLLLDPHVLAQKPELSNILKLDINHTKFIPAIVDWIQTEFPRITFTSSSGMNVNRLNSNKVYSRPAPQFTVGSSIENKKDAL
jgi:hypothetical protein